MTIEQFLSWLDQRLAALRREVAALRRDVERERVLAKRRLLKAVAWLN